MKSVLLAAASAAALMIPGQATAEAADAAAGAALGTSKQAAFQRFSKTDRS